MLGSSTSSTVSMSRLLVWRICRTSSALLACKAFRKRCFSCLTASFLGLNSSMLALREPLCSMYGTAKPASSDTNALHAAHRTIEKKAQMVIVKESNIPTMKGLCSPSHQPLYGRCKTKEDRNQAEEEGQQVTTRRKIALE